jgi:ribosome maturation factor RimP
MPTTTGQRGGDVTSPGSRELRDLLEPAVNAAGMDLEDVAISQAGRRRRIRLSIDKDGGVTLDECAEVSRLVEDLLDQVEELSDGPYTLEVSSPGVRRPLTLPRHWRRNIGRLVHVHLRDGQQVTGRVRGADEHGAVLDLGGIERAVAFDEVSKARVQVELNKPADSDNTGE